MDPIVLAPGDGELVRDAPSHRVWIKAGLDEIALTESIYGPGQSGPGPHIHREHVDSFWVLDGELAFDVGPDQETVPGPAGSFVLVPPGVTHTFRNEGPGRARFLNVHVPSKDFHRYMRGEDVGFDTEDPPEGGGRPASEALVLAPGNGRELGLGPATLTIKAGRNDCGGRFSLTLGDLPADGVGPPLHRHREYIDSFYVLDGTLTLRLGSVTRELGEGGYALVPPGVAHTFANPSEAPARFLNLMLPGGFERYFEEAAGADPERIPEIAARYDFEPAG
jgi:mannose-6-phosphate isomerase-like protein (cupin superfamily)